MRIILLLTLLLSVTAQATTIDGKKNDDCSVRYEEGAVRTYVKGLIQECQGSLECLGAFAEDLFKNCEADHSICTDESLKGSCQDPETFIMGTGYWVLFSIIGVIVVGLLGLCLYSLCVKKEDYTQVRGK